MEENKDLFLTGCDTLLYLTGPLHKKYSTIFVWGYPFSTYVAYDRFFNFVSEKQFKVKKTYLMTTEIDIIGEK